MASRVVEPSGETKDRDELVSFFKEDDRLAVAKVLHKIWPFIEVTENNEVIYLEKNGNSTAGSGIVELLGYFVLGEGRKPSDAGRFLKILRNAGVLKKELKRKNNCPDEETETPPKKWHSLY